MLVMFRYFWYWKKVNIRDHVWARKSCQSLDWIMGDILDLDNPKSEFESFKLLSLELDPWMDLDFFVYFDSKWSSQNL